MAKSSSHIDWFVRQTAKALLVGALAIVVLTSAGQETFNKRYPIGNGGLFTQLEVFEDSYLVLGFGGPENVILWTENLRLIRIGVGGDVVQTQILGDELEIYQPFQKTSIRDENTGLIYSAVMRKTIGINDMRCAIYTLDESLNAELLGEYISPYYTPDDFNSASALPRDIKVAPDGSIYLTFAIFQPGSGNHFTVLKILPSGDVDWEYVYATNSVFDMCFSMVSEEDGVVFAAISEGVDFQSTIRRFIKLSAETGLEMWNYPINSADVGALFDLMKIENQFIAGTSTLQGLGGVPMIFELNEFAELQWSNLPEVSLTHQTAQSANLLDLTTDGNIVVGANHLVPDLELGGFEREEAWIIKLSPTGEQIWERKFFFEAADCFWNKMYDLKATPDGGLIFCGESYLCTNVEGPDQQGWVVKLDSCGCLVPGCDPNCIIDGVAESAQAKEALMVAGPNPAAGSEFYVHVRTTEAGSLRIHDLQGLEVKNIRLRGEGTYAVGCSDWAAGGYLVSLVGDDGGVLQSLKVVKE